MLFSLDGVEWFHRVEWQNSDKNIGFVYKISITLHIPIDVIIVQFFLFPWKSRKCHSIINLIDNFARSRNRFFFSCVWSESIERPSIRVFLAILWYFDRQIVFNAHWNQLLEVTVVIFFFYSCFAAFFSSSSLSSNHIGALEYIHPFWFIDSVRPRLACIVCHCVSTHRAAAE